MHVLEARRRVCGSPDGAGSMAAHPGGLESGIRPASVLVVAARECEDLVYTVAGAEALFAMYSVFLSELPLSCVV